MDMATGLYYWSVLLTLIGLSVQKEVTPAVYRLTTPTNYSGSSFTSDCTFSPNSQGLRGCGSNTRLINDITDIGTTVFNPNNFIGWNSSISNVTLQFNFGSASVDIRQVDIYFYHNPTEGYGLPDIEYFYSFDDVDYTSFISTVGDNYELSQTDNEVQMVSLLLPPFGANYQYYRLVFNFTSYQINQTFISEVVSFTAISSAIANDPIQFLSPNQMIQLGPSTLHPSIQLTCTVTNNGSFIWSWAGPGVDNRKTQVLLADTSRTSILLISRLSANDSGNYTCTAHYEHSALDLPPGTTPINTAHRTSTNVALTLRGSVSVVSPVVAMRDDNITINCTFTGYLPTNYQVIWRDTEGDDIENNSTVTITNTPLGQSQRSGTNIQDAILTTLSISSIEEDDYGSYTCLIIGTNLTGTVMVQEPPPPPSSSSAVIVPSSSSSSIISSSTTSTIIPTSNPTLPLSAIGGMVTGAVILLILIVIVAVIIIILVVRTKTSKSLRLADRVGSSDGLYEVPTKPSPPPLPYRQLISSDGQLFSDGYASIDIPNTNGHIFKLSEIPPKSPPTSPQHSLDQQPTPAQISSKPDFLQANPMYASSEKLDRPNNEYLRPTKSLPFLEKDEESKDMGSQFNIYAKPSIVPPPIPPFRGTPDPEGDDSDHEYTVEGFNPDLIKRQTLQGHETPPYVGGYHPIYSDPQPLQRSDNMLLEVREKNVRELRELGMGQFGVVVLAHTVGLSLRQLGMSESNTDTGVSLVVAIKRLKSEADDKMREMFEKEVKFMARLKNENVVRLLGVCLSNDAFIMMEYMDNGDLNHYLRKQELIEESYPLPENSVTVPILLYMCLQVSQGMRYLASLRFIHRDLATRNILVGQDFKVKIADFGMSQNLYSDFYYRIQGRAVLPIRWMANECFYGRFSEKTDVWSFGVLMWEIFTLCRQQPYENMTDQEVIDDAIKGDERLLLYRPPPCPEEVYDVMLKCWIHSPDERASFEDIYNMISSIHAYNDLS